MPPQLNSLVIVDTTIVSSEASAHPVLFTCFIHAMTTMLVPLIVLGCLAVVVAIIAGGMGVLRMIEEAREREKRENEDNKQWMEERAVSQSIESSYNLLAYSS